MCDYTETTVINSKNALTLLYTHLKTIASESTLLATLWQGRRFTDDMDEQPSLESIALQKGRSEGLLLAASILKDLIDI